MASQPGTKSLMGCISAIIYYFGYPVRFQICSITVHQFDIVPLSLHARHFNKASTYLFTHL
jgi:hypothetical protein